TLSLTGSWAIACPARADGETAGDNLFQVGGGPWFGTIWAWLMPVHSERVRHIAAAPPGKARPSNLIGYPPAIMVLAFSRPEQSVDTSLEEAQTLPLIVVLEDGHRLARIGERDPRAR